MQWLLNFFVLHLTQNFIPIHFRYEIDMYLPEWVNVEIDTWVSDMRASSIYILHIQIYWKLFFMRKIFGEDAALLFFTVWFLYWPIYCLNATCLRDNTLYHYAMTKCNAIIIINVNINNNNQTNAHDKHSHQILNDVDDKHWDLTWTLKIEQYLFVMLFYYAASVFSYSLI